MQQSIRNSITQPKSSTSLVAEIEGRKAGFVLYQSLGHSDGTIIPSAWASLRLLATDPDFAGQGVGRRLVEACIDRAVQDGGSDIGLYTSELMQRAREIYQRMGFLFVREIEKRHGLRYWLFRKSLTSDDA